jgi:glycerol-3-phosphate acyltransferase PlsY
MDILLVVVSVLAGYFLGALSFARIVSRIASPSFDLEDVHIPSSQEDGDSYRFRSVSATAASMKLGGKVGCLIGWLDMFKVALPTLFFKLMFPDQPYFLFAASAGMMGHNWPVYYRFNGGSGISSIYGAMFVIDWLGALVCAFAGLFFGMVVVKDVLVSYLSGVWFLIPWLWFRTNDPYHVGYAVLVNLLFMLSLIPEIGDAIRSRKEGTYDFALAMKSIPMGRGMLKMMDFLQSKKVEE